MKGLEKSDTTNKADQKRLTMQVEEIQKEIINKKTELNKNKTELEKYVINIPKYEKDAEKFRKKMDKEKEVFDELDAKIQSETEGIKSELKKLEGIKGKLRLKIKKEDNEIEQCKEQLGGMNLNREQNEIKQYEESIKNENENLKNLELDYKNICEKLEKSNAKKIQDLQQEILTLNTKKDDVNEEITRIASEIDEARNGNDNMGYQQNILDILLKAQDEGKLSGIRGRLGDLGAIDKLYDVAISTACTKLNMIVVETIDDANKVLKYLRNNRIGQASCLALDQTAKSFLNYMNKEFVAPNDSKRLFDLIRPSSEEYKVAFYSVAQNTLVVNNIDKASEIAFGQQRQRVVTLAGELFEKSGVISGGGKQKSGIMSSRSKRRSVAKKTLDIDSLIEKRSILNHKYQEIEDQIKAIQTKIYELGNSHANREAEAFKERYPAQKRAMSHRLLKSEEGLKECCSRYEGACKRYEDKENQLKALIDKIDKEGREEYDTIENRISELMTDIEAAGGQDYIDARSKYEEAKMQYDK